MTPEETARRWRWDARLAFQRLMDARLAGDPVDRAALDQRYAAIRSYQEGTIDVGEREEVNSQAGRVN